MRGKTFLTSKHKKAAQMDGLSSLPHQLFSTFEERIRGEEELVNPIVRVSPKRSRLKAADTPFVSVDLTLTSPLSLCFVVRKGTVNTGRHERVGRVDVGMVSV